MIMSCPICASHNVHSNKIGEGALEHIANVGRMARASQYPVVSFASVALWSGLQAINSLRKEWRCDACGYRF
jgi:hypothetical protein